ncbi:TonB family protein [Algoriphagus sp. D3-2-R+10]|uniref:TonB family protein n=1 Tax=Algoriphagus aurantiacus TaxID=3103948 RepID=UPI002B370FA0|nr:TonB family protein [Algoriphagus sp. D3-2-R+10]MEB2776428.1 TonB family protein [Algoriphagus sp. D3-2-R+10]
MKLKSIILFIIFNTVLSLSLLAQGREITKLDKYYRTLTEGQDSLHVYNRISTIGKDSSTIEKIYDLQNRMLQSSKVSFNKEVGYNELVEERFDTTKNRKSIKYFNLDNGKFFSYYFKNGEQASSLEFDGEKTYKLLGKDMKEPLITEYDPLTLTPKFTVADRNDYYLQNLKYPSQARMRGEQGVVKLLHQIDVNGNVKSREILDPEQTSSILHDEAIRLSKLFDPQFYPLYDVYGDPKEGVFVMPTVFRLSRSRTVF